MTIASGDSPILQSSRHAWIALGSNAQGAWGHPQACITKALETLAENGVAVRAVSPIYITAAIGGGRQPAFLNAVACVNPGMPAASLLRLLKSIERAAGRRLGRHWGPRPLDLDVLGTGSGFRRSAPRTRIPGRIIIPHPHLHQRAFVIVPLAHLAPHWWHPFLHRTARQLLRSTAISRQARSVRRQPGTL